MAHTPGPWAYRPDEYDDWGVVKSPPREVGDYDPPFITRGVIGQIRDPDNRSEEALNEHRRAGTDPWEANARLVASAPDLLEALEDLMAMRSKCFIPNEDDWWDDKARAAIARAKGEA